MAIGVDFEEAGEKWRGGDAVKVSAVSAKSYMRPIRFVTVESNIYGTPILNTGGFHRLKLHETIERLKALY